jgi:hypothetical protein
LLIAPLAFGTGYGHASIWADVGASMGEMGGRIGEAFGSFGERIGDVFGGFGDGVGHSVGSAFSPHFFTRTIFFIIPALFFLFGFILILAAARSRRQPA